MQDITETGARKIGFNHGVHLVSLVDKHRVLATMRQLKTLGALLYTQYYDAPDGDGRSELDQLSTQFAAMGDSTETSWLWAAYHEGVENGWVWGLFLLGQEKPKEE